jgi:hypothetical protein
VVVSAQGSPKLLKLAARGVWLARCKTLVREHVADLGGEDNISFAEKVLVKRCATLITELERREMLFSVAGCASRRLKNQQTVIVAAMLGVLVEIGRR